MRIVFGEPVSVEGLEATPEDAATAINTVWPQVSEEYDRWLTRPTTVAVAAAAVGVGGWLVRQKLRK